MKKPLSSLSQEALNQAIDLCLTAPSPQFAIHHLIDKVLELYDPNLQPDNQNPV